MSRHLQRKNKEKGPKPRPSWVKAAAKTTKNPILQRRSRSAVGVHVVDVAGFDDDDDDEPAYEFRK